SEEHTSELQSLTNLVCRLLLEKKKTTTCAPRLARRTAPTPTPLQGRPTASPPACASRTDDSRGSSRTGTPPGPGSVRRDSSLHRAPAVALALASAQPLWWRAWLAHGLSVLLRSTVQLDPAVALFRRTLALWRQPRTHVQFFFFKKPPPPTLLLFSPPGPFPY